ncbi:hypothetical protein ACQ33O_08080 [Ferruginibacter sp. SUN002]|uniref:hypothetical protein n=1 Tax=Ferruginibacter sp. SUN002 TaxID=2937789 RepID=UPI003D363DF5
MKILSSFLLMTLIGIFSGCGTTQYSTDDDKIFIWAKDKAIVWTDFRGSIPAEDANVKWSAVTFSFIAYRIVDKNKTLIGAYFDRSQSWVIRQRDDLLKHEQYHFNITEIFARQIREKVTKNKLLPGSPSFDYVYSMEIAKCNTMQKEYDDATEHGKNKEEQLRQEKLIDEKLTALDAFKDPMAIYASKEY